MRYHIWTEGCQMNEADSDKLAAGLAHLGWEPARKAEDADLAVVNTCVIRQKAEDRAIGYMSHLRKLKETNGGLQVAVMGCMVGPRTDDLRERFPFVDVWARPQSFEVILRHILPGDDLGGEFWPDVVAEPHGATAFLPVVHGCNKFCTYCIVPYRRGRERSRTVDGVVREATSLTRRGVKELTLLGQTVEAYGKDLPAVEGRKPDLADLFEALANLDGLERIRFLTSYPRDMTDRIIQSVAAVPQVCEHFNIPVQSGDDEVLAKMRRGYTVGEYLDCVTKIRHHVPGASLSTDVIVGFCGETEEQFLNTLRLLDDIRYDKVHVAAYSPRPGTIAWRHLEDTVPQDEKMRRLHAVEEQQERIAREINERLAGTVQEVLVEGDRPGDDGRVVFTGRNRGNKLVHFTSEYPVAVGDMARVRVERTTPWSLQGAFADAAVAV